MDKKIKKHLNTNLKIVNYLIRNIKISYPKKKFKPIQLVKDIFEIKEKLGFFNWEKVIDIHFDYKLERLKVDIYIYKKLSFLEILKESSAELEAGLNKRLSEWKIKTDIHKMF